MASIWVPEAFSALSGDGTAAGYCPVASNAGFYPGAEVFVQSATEDGRRGVIVDLSSTTGIGVRLTGEFPNNAPQYGKSPMDFLHLADSATINMPAQVVRVDQPTFSKLAKF